MKKNLLLVALTAGVSFALAQSTFNVKADTNVKVSKNTLLYVNGDVNLENYTTDQKLSNEGFVRVTKGFKNANTGTNNKDGVNFVNEYEQGSHYGQLIIDNGATTVSGQIEGELKLRDNYAYHSIAFPFVGYTTTDLNRDAFGGNAIFRNFQPHRSNGYDNKRYTNSIYTWNNNEYTFDHLANGIQLKPGNFYSLNTFNSNNGVANTANITTYDGVPNHNNTTVSVIGYDLSNTSNKAKNRWGEMYGSYISDFTRAKPTGWGNISLEIAGEVKPSDGSAADFGSNIFWLGNPFNSNIDLSQDNSFTSSNVVAIKQSTPNTYKEELNWSSASGGSTMGTGVGAGDPVLLVRPFHIFAVKLQNLPDGSEYNFNFIQAMKTFEDKAGSPNIMLAKGSKKPEIYQVGMDLYDRDMNKTNSRFYVVAGDIYKAEAMGDTELYDVDFLDKGVGVYTLQETESGEVAPQFVNHKTYVNGVNFSYVGKPIHIVFQTDVAQKFTFKPRLNETLANSKYNFYFEDKQEGVIKKVDENFEYTFNIDKTSKDRFVMYWMETPSNITPEEIDEVEVAQTIVFKDFGQYKVRFDSDWTKADIFVYAISGQLLYSDKNIATDSDYTLKLNDNINVYVVKVINEDGQSVSKKIIK